jgi:hypothetical protein
MDEKNQKPLSTADLWQIRWEGGAKILFGGRLLVAQWLLDCQKITAQANEHGNRHGHLCRWRGQRQRPII